MRSQSLRGWMDVLQQEGILKTVRREVSLECYLSPNLAVRISPTLTVLS